jgi:hypothetical protein
MEAASLAPALAGGPPFNIKERGHNNRPRALPTRAEPITSGISTVACDAQARRQRKLDALSR